MAGNFFLFWSPFPTKRSTKIPQKIGENSEQNSGQNSGWELPFCIFLTCNFSDLIFFLLWVLFLRRSLLAIVLIAMAIDMATRSCFRCALSPQRPLRTEAWPIRGCVVEGCLGLPGLGSQFPLIEYKAPTPKIPEDYSKLQFGPPKKSQSQKNRCVSNRKCCCRNCIKIARDRRIIHRKIAEMVWGTEKFRKLKEAVAVCEMRSGAPEENSGKVPGK